MKQIQVALLGAGNRGKAYCDYSLAHPEEMKVVSVIDIDALHLREAGERYGVADGMRFSDLDAFLHAKIGCDLVVDATMDEMHYPTAVQLLRAGYDLLLEKPITAKREELLHLRALAKEHGARVFVCHVLRYTPYFKRIKALIDAGEIGTILTMEMNEHVWVAHFMDSYVRGKWNSEKKCGSGFLLAKSCHDTDLICWLNNAARPVSVSSFGSRSLFTEKNMPQDAAEFCYDCPHLDSCMYSAKKIHLELDSMPFQTWLGIGKPIGEITREEKENYLKTSDYGRCAYRSGGDIADRQTLNIAFDNGSLAVFTMVGGTSEAGRRIHICGSKGEIYGKLEEDKFTLVRLCTEGGMFTPVYESIDVSKEVVQSKEYGGHSGGDYAIMHDLVRYLNGDRSSPSITGLDDSVNGHLIVYAAEESRKSGKIVHVDLE